MKLAVIGSRDFTDWNLLCKTLDNYDIELIVSGNATGADQLAERYAIEFKILTKIFFPDWRLYGKSAGAIRNKLIVDNADQVVVFWDGESKGSKISIDYAKSKGIPVDIILFKPSNPSAIADIGA